MVIDIVVPFYADFLSLKKLVSIKISRLNQSINDKVNFRFVFLWRPTCGFDAEHFSELCQDNEKKAIILLTEQPGIYTALNTYLSTMTSDGFIFEGDNDLIYTKDIRDHIYIHSKKLIIFDVIESRTRKTLRPYSLPGLSSGANFSVGVFVPKIVAINFTFDESYTIAADTKFLLEVLGSKIPCQYIKLVSGEFTRDGISSTNYSKTVCEHSKALWQTGHSIASSLFILKRLPKLCLHLIQ